jgi:hypothetical protein
MEVRKYKIPKSEYCREYVKRGEIDPALMLLECDYEIEEDEWH